MGQVQEWKKRGLSKHVDLHSKGASASENAEYSL